MELNKARIKEQVEQLNLSFKHWKALEELQHQKTKDTLQTLSWLCQSARTHLFSRMRYICDNDTRSISMVNFLRENSECNHRKRLEAAYSPLKSAFDKTLFHQDKEPSQPFKEEDLTRLVSTVNEVAKAIGLELEDCSAEVSADSVARDIHKLGEIWSSEHSK